MTGVESCSIHLNTDFSAEELKKGIYLVVTEANTVPPHIGMMIDGSFSSLTLKGHELNIQCGVLLKNIALRKIPALFIRIKDHPVFSHTFFSELLQSCITEHRRVESGGPTCLSPVKQFFREGYQLPIAEIEFLFDLIPALEGSGLISSVYPFHLQGEKFILPVYTRNEIDSRIQKVRSGQI